MAYVHRESDGPDLDPPPAIATAEEIVLAAQLRRALERRYLGNASPALGGERPPQAQGRYNGVG
jgi:hypothetical protein